MRKQGTSARALGGVAAVAVAAAFLASSALAQSSSASLAPPKNYRAQIAAKLRHMEDNPSAIQYVGITQPRQMFVGLFNGGTRPAVCVQVERPNIFGIRAAWYYLFYFENGRVDGFKMVATSALQQALQRCEPPLSPMTDLVRSRR
ncbi:MAG: hypothetical protein K2X43_24170 [Hyphomonadaceae bacterium]|jgi:hypothetical protein|nr:hypothetical protein [Hyphomonadaceae bacterium]